MTNLDSKLGTFVSELKRRRVLRFAVLYLMVGFAFIEGTDLISPTLQLPDQVYDWVVIVTLVGFPIALALAWTFDLTRSGLKRTDPLGPSVAPVEDAASEVAVVDRSEDTTVVEEPREGPAEKSIAVLPFMNMGAGSEDEYLSDGIAEELIHRLAKVPDLRVAARTSSFAFRGLNLDVTKIGGQLRVATVVEGSVQRRGERLRVTAQLIDTADGFHLWSETYDRPATDVFDIQDDIACAIADRLRLELLRAGGKDAIRCCTESLEAYGHYLKGRYVWNRRTGDDLRESIEFYERALEADDRFALAYSGLADSYSLLGWYRHLTPEEAFGKTKWAAQAAIEVDDSLAEAHSSLAYAKFLYDWDWAGAEDGFRHAIGLNPNYSTALHWYAEFLMAMGRFTEAEDTLARAQSLDPLSLSIATGNGWLKYFTGQYEEAIARYEDILALNPDFVIIPWFLGPAYVQAGEHEKAAALYGEWSERLEDQPGLEAFRAQALALAGRRAEAVEVFGALETGSSSERIPPDNRALVALALGRTNDALARLEEACARRCWPLAFLGVEPAYASLSDEPRFITLLERIGLEIRA
jgi:serine/threonine-protein kinase